MSDPRHPRRPGFDPQPKHLGLSRLDADSDVHAGSYDAPALVTWELGYLAAKNTRFLSPSPLPNGPCGGDTVEVFDGFMLQGDEVQTLAWDPRVGGTLEPTGKVGRIGNRAFDLRDNEIHR